MKKLILLAALAASALATPAGASTDHASEPLVVRGTDTVVDGGACPAGVCTLTLTNGSFHGTTGAGAYDGVVKLMVGKAFPNGEGGVCAPIRGKITLGGGTPDRLVLALRGDSCQDGAGDPSQASFTGLADFTVVHGTGKYAGAHGHGLFSSTEGADDREHMTLIGRISR